VKEVWESADLQQAFSNVWQRLGRVLRLIEEDDGGNDLVETKRGKKWSALDQPLPGEAPAGEEASAASAASVSVQHVVDLLEDDEDDEFEE